MSKRKNLNKSFEESVKRTLEKEGIDYLQGVYAGGTAADFFIQTPTSGSVILETKVWKATPENSAWARRIAESTKKGAKVNQAFVVIPGNTYLNPESGLISLYQIPEVIKNPVIKSQDKIKTPEILKLLPKHEIFVAMPFKDIYEDTFRVGIEPACTAVDSKCTRVDEEVFSGDIAERILADISKSDLVIADISENKPNVLFEYGYAKGLKKPIIPICSTDFKNIPFDIRQEKTLEYKKGQTYKLKELLINNLRILLSN
jgi:hypothetical protein